MSDAATDIDTDEVPPDKRRRRRRREQEEADIAGGTRIGRYILLYRLGKGGMGRVYAAHDPQLDRRLAIKVLSRRRRRRSKNAHARMLREAQALARLSHPNVVAVHDVGVWEGRVWLAMDLIEGPTLRVWADKQTRTPREIVDVYVQAGRGLAAAHAAGLVHRDFKPDNAIVSSSGRVQVLDFGLARAAASKAGSELGSEDPSADEPSADEPSAAESGDRFAVPLTREGALVGTPGYMAPEQIKRIDVDARTDQFSFCLALYEALYGVSPFGGDDDRALRREVVAGRVRPPPAGAKVPAWLRAILLQGLRSDPALRYDSMDALLAELSRDRGARLRRGLMLGVTVSSVGLAVWGLSRAPQDAGEQCRQGAGGLTQTYDAQRAVRIDAAFTATGKPYAATTSSTVLALLDGWAQRWTAAYHAACDATHDEATQTPSQLAGRLECLQTRREELDALLTVYERADARVVSRAVQALHELVPVSACEGDVLDEGPPTPAHPSARDHARRIRARLARARALERAGQYDEGVVLAREVVGQARDLAFRPVEAEALVELGTLLLRNADLSGASQTLQDAIVAAEAGGHPEVAARAWVELLGVAHLLPDLHPRVDEWRRHAGAHLERLEEPPALTARMHLYLGKIREFQGKYDEAVRLQEYGVQIEERHRGETPALGEALIALGNALGGAARYEEGLTHQTRALKILERQLGPTHPEVGSALTGMAINANALGDAERSHELHRRATEVFRNALGPKHTKVATAINNLATVHYARGEYEEALDRFREAAEIWTEAYSPAHPDVALTRGNIGLSLDALGRYDEAMHEHEAALAIWHEAFGPDHPEVATAHANLGDLQAFVDRHEDAREHHARALEILRVSLGVDHPRVASALVGLGYDELELGQVDTARGRFERALQIRLERHGSAHASVASARTALGVALQREGDAASALVQLSSALQTYDGLGVDPDESADTKFRLAQAMWSRPRRRDEARALAAEALRGLPADEPANEPLRAEIAAWRRAHP